MAHGFYRGDRGKTTGKKSRALVWERTKGKGRTYSASFLRVRSSKSACTLEIFLVKRADHLSVVGLVGLALGHLLGHCLFLVHHGCSYPDQRILVPSLHVENIFHFIERGQGSQDRSRPMCLVSPSSVMSGKVKCSRGRLGNLNRVGVS